MLKLNYLYTLGNCKVIFMLNNYINSISQLDNFEKDDIICDKFTIEQNGRIQIIYAPHNEYVNKSAKILIVGICPGWTQTQIAYKTFFEDFQKGIPVPEIQKHCKFNSRFAGSMRKNLIDMLNDLHLNEHLGIENCTHLFDEECSLLHTTSLIPYPVFINGKNYTGHNPDILKSKILSTYVEKYFHPESEHFKNALIIPLGKSVDDVLKDMCNKGILTADKILFGFPHTSGANGHRKKQFEENKTYFIKIVKKYFNEI